MKVVWIKGERVVSKNLKGKNGGMHVDQKVVKAYVPKKNG